jgi:hypothetical protein
MEGGKTENLEKNPCVKVENNTSNKLNSRMVTELRLNPQPLEPQQWRQVFYRYATHANQHSIKSGVSCTLSIQVDY